VEVSGELHGPAPLPPAEGTPPSVTVKSLGERRAGLGMAANRKVPASTGTRTPAVQFVASSLYRLGTERNVD